MARGKSIRDGLTAATCTLVGFSVAPVAEATEVDTSVLVYTENDKRINAFESMTRARMALGGDKYLDAHLTVDILTGASPNGAAPADGVQTFTRPSGRGSYSVRAGLTPLDDTFQDNRGAIGVTLEVPMGRRYTGRVGTRGSIEYDYVSFGASGMLSRDFNRGNTTIAAGVEASADFLDPEGGQPIPFAPMLPPGVPPNRLPKNEHKAVWDGLVSLTQVVNRAAVMRLNYSMNYADGYLTDPFKIISAVDPTPGPNQGQPVEYLYENRPGVRTRQSLYGALKSQAFGDVIDASYRYMRDDWSIRSHTIELRYRWWSDERRSYQPQVRYYRQSAADFYVHSLRSGEPLPEHATADYRLGEFDALTVAVKFAGRTERGHMINLRLGYYFQMGDSSPPGAIGSQRHHDLFPTVTALIVQAGYTATW